MRGQKRKPVSGDEPRDGFFTGKPDDPTRLSTGRDAEGMPPGCGSIRYASDDANLPDLNAGGIGERGPTGYAERIDPEVMGPEEMRPHRSTTYSPNDDVVGEGWTLPEQRNEGWVLPEDPPLEERLDSSPASQNLSKPPPAKRRSKPRRKG